MDNIELERSYPTPLSNSTLLPLLLLSLAKQRHTVHSSNFIKDEYDFIVVGGGAAGSVVASRLSEVPCVSVLLLEAGPEPPRLTEVPTLGGYYKGTDVDWQYITVPQKYGAFGLENRQVKWAAGKMLGGSASHNGLTYIRGSPQYYDDWESLGATGWSYQDVFPYFTRLENYRTSYFANNGYHAVGGPITVEQPKLHLDFKDGLAFAADELGYQFVDPNAGSITGFYELQKNMRNAQRCSSVKGYLVPAENRTNLDILLNAFVSKVVIKDAQVKGVEYYYKGQRFIIKAKQEVILSAGTIGTPKILMLSGVGPREELQKWNIPEIANLPVGKNLQDHATSLYFFTLDPRYPSFDKKMSDPDNIKEYITSRTGLLTSGPCIMQAHLNGQSPESLTDRPDYALLFEDFPESRMKELSLTEKVYKQFAAPYENRAINVCKCQQIKPRSKGSITLRSLNPFDHPLIDPKYYEITRDLEDIVDGLEMCKKIINTKSMKRLGAQEFETVFPGCETFVGNDTAYFRCYARHLTFTNYHCIGTARMGNSLDPTTVVDPELRVKYIKGLRVVDASVMPTIPSPNINIPTVMVAEKGSDMIRKLLFCGEKKTFNLHAEVKNEYREKKKGNFNIFEVIL